MNRSATPLPWGSPTMAASSSWANHPREPGSGVIGAGSPGRAGAIDEDAREEYERVTGRQPDSAEMLRLTVPPSHRPTNPADRGAPSLRPGLPRVPRGSVPGARLAERCLVYSSTRITNVSGKTPSSSMASAAALTAWRTQMPPCPERP